MVAVVLLLGIVSIWVTPDTDLTTGVGLIRAGPAFALQQVITSLAAYFVILPGDTFSVGDPITLGGVRGEVVRLGFLKTTIMEIGQPPAVQTADPPVWVHLAAAHRPSGHRYQRVIFPDPVSTTRVTSLHLGRERAAHPLHRRPGPDRTSAARGS